MSKKLIKMIIAPFLIAFVFALFFGPVLCLVYGLYVLFLVNCFISFITFLWFAITGGVRRHKMKMVHRMLFSFFALISLFVAVVYLKDVPGYLGSDWKVSEGHAVNVEIRSKGGAAIKMEGINFKLGKPNVPNNPTERKYRITYLSHSKFILKCEYEIGQEWRRIPACY